MPLLPPAAAHTLLLLVSLLPAVASTTADEAQWSGAALAIDGNTIEVDNTTLRVWGIDAPESWQWCFRDGTARWRCGQVAQSMLQERVDGATMHCVRHGAAVDGIVQARCRLDQVDLSEWMVSEGWALDWPAHSDGALAGLQNDASSARRGIWGSRFVLPWEWRAGRRYR